MSRLFLVFVSMNAAWLSPRTAPASPDTNSRPLRPAGEGSQQNPCRQMRPTRASALQPSSTAGLENGSRLDFGRREPTEEPANQARLRRLTRRVWHMPQFWPSCRVSRAGDTRIEDGDSTAPTHRRSRHPQRTHNQRLHSRKNDAKSPPGRDNTPKRHSHPGESGTSGTLRNVRFPRATGQFGTPGMVIADPLIP